MGMNVLDLDGMIALGSFGLIGLGLFVKYGWTGFVEIPQDKIPPLI